MLNLIGKTLKELEQILLPYVKEPYRVRQIYHWIYQRNAKSFFEMTELSKDLRRRLDENFSINYPYKEREIPSKDGCIKFLFKLSDGKKIESVLIPEVNRNTFCISTQVGCKMGCIYCLTGKMGFKRNLEVEEIVSQVLILLEKVKPRDRRVNIVFMGMGEPMDNLENLKKAITLITDPNGIAISPRRVTVSTIGIPGTLKSLREIAKPPKIAISINSLDEEKREFLMPATKKFKLSDVLKEMESLKLRKGERITIEWVLIKNINDGEDEIERIKKLSRKVPIKVNVIPYNFSPLLPFERTEEKDAENFALKIEREGISVTVRRRRGEDISASCGQLAIIDEK